MAPSRSEETDEFRFLIFFSLTAEVPVGDPEVEGAEALAGEDPGAVGQVSEDVLQVLVYLCGVR